MEPRRYLRCLGQPGLFAPTGEPIRFRTKKHLALLVYLAVEGRQQHRRDRLAELFWPRVPLAESRHSLATALSVLRPRLGPGALEATRDQVGLAVGRVELDLDRLAAGDVLGTETVEPLEVAAFLEGFDIPDAREFALWKDRQHARWLPAVLSAFGQVLERCRRVGDTRQIEQLADRMLALDELYEDAIRAKMEALAFAGDRLSALRLYEDWRTKIAEDLKAAPSAQLERMAARLRQKGWERAPLGDLPAASADQARGRPFVGRSSEYRFLYDAWVSQRTGKTAHVLVLGDSGVGKTRLVERLTTAAGLDGAAVTRVQCYELEREIPYAAVSGLVTGLLACPEVSGTRPEALAELSRTVPEIRRRYPSIPPAKDSQGDTARIELAEAFHQFLQPIAEERPVVLVVDDLHLADDASLSVLHLMARCAIGQRIMMILIARPAELVRSTQAELLRRGSAALGIRELELRELTVEESTDLLTCLLPVEGNAPTIATQRCLLKAAGGYPMVLELLIQDWVANGDESLALAVSAMTLEFAARRERPETYRQILSGMVRNLDPATQNVLYLAAILGPRLNDLSLYALADLGLGQTMAGLAQLASLRVLRDSGRGLEFVNELLRAEVYAAVPSPLRRALHGTIADRLLGRALGTGEVSGLEIAWHCVRAGRHEQAIPHLLVGAREAMRGGAADTAQRALESALPAISGADRLEAMLLLVESLQEQGRWRESLDRLHELPGGDTQAPSWQAQVLRALAMQNLGTSYVSQLRDTIPELTALVRDCPDSKARVRAGRVLAYLAAELRERELATDLLRLVDAIPVGDADEDTLSQLALTRGLLLYFVGDSTASHDEVLSMSQDVRRRGTVNLVAAKLLSGLGTINTLQGRYEEAANYFLQAYEMASRLGIDTMIVAVIGNLSLCYGRLGKYEQQHAWASRAQQPWGAEFGGFIEVQLAYNRGMASGMRGRKEEVLRAIQDLERRMTRPSPPWLQQAWLLWKADLLLLADLRVDAYACARQACSRFGKAPLSASFTGPFARWSALTCRLEPERNEAMTAINNLCAQIGDFDALDQVELLCARLVLEGDRLLGGQTVLDQLKGRLGKLPPATAVFLRRMEILKS